MAGPSFDLRELWQAIAREYRALNPRISGLRPPGPNYLQLDAGGKAAHYEWKALNAPKRHIEVALHFEGPEVAENEQALEQTLKGGDARLRAGTLTPFRAGRWGGRWTRVGFQVEFVDRPDEEAIKRSAELMALLVERTYPQAIGLLEAGARTGWPAA